jgi:hypothetical protein
MKQQQLQIRSWMENAKQDNWKGTKKIVLIQPIDMPLPAGCGKQEFGRMGESH